MSPAIQAMIDEMTAEVKATTDAEDSAEVAFAAVPGLIAKAQSDALANGASAAELQPFSDLAAALKASAAKLAAAVVANTPAATP